MSEWIPVSERLPDEGEHVLWLRPGDAFCRCVVGRREGEMIDWGGDIMVHPAAEPRVTHWMPLPPEPPGSY